MTAKQTTVSLYWHFRASSDLLLPRYTPLKWWECDMWRLTKNGYTDEFEIKLSVSDFKADFGKVDSSRMRYNEVTTHFEECAPRVKHELLKSSAEGPNRFWFVLPEEIAAKVEIPAYAGLIIPTRHGCWVKIQAPKRHRAKWVGNRGRILETFYHRFWMHEVAVKTDVEPSAEPTPTGADEPSEVPCGNAAADLTLL